MVKNVDIIKVSAVSVDTYTEGENECSRGYYGHKRHCTDDTVMQMRYYVYIANVRSLAS